LPLRIGCEENEFDRASAWEAVTELAGAFAVLRGRHAYD